ncbi:hypothetical protein M409DRAFT_49129 [Zasmidium cellare ATCC 36951]|uniref:Small ribosomal subunit protein bS18m n=1 Tax=Zasmidium cellare ATCC 36951 TaxID=1080233 RepID=A0A6A6D4B8_ZASCE|nr:uncharacterized protein M409DRAFT_49129 [Zasmidium cellare ATCC 36951]KAF2174271.1 hypothetical protein M409DRAFT_49129 [Zasmidium cellare ATCC 36951]
MLDGFLESSRSQRTTNSPRQQQPSPSTLPSSQSPWAMANSAVAEATQKSRTEQNRVALADLRRSYTRKDLEQQVFRRWKTGDIYSPRDLSGVEASKWKKVSKKPRPRRDVLDQLGVNPLHYYTNFSIMGEYTTEMGKIRSGNETGLRPVNQRKMAKAIRRAKGVGLLMPGTHLHPEVLRLQAVDQLRTPRR